MLVLSAAAECCLHVDPRISLLRAVSVMDITVAHRTFSVYFMSSKEQSRHGKFNCFLFSVVIQPLPKDIAPVICTWAQIHSSAPPDAPALQLCSFLWVTDAAKALLPSSEMYKRRGNAGMRRIFTQWSKVDYVFITD